MSRWIELEARITELEAENEALKEERNGAIEGLIDIILRVTKSHRAGLLSLTFAEGDIVTRAHALTKPPYESPDEDS